MSVLRLLSPSRNHASTSRIIPAVPVLTLHVPQYGAIFMNRGTQSSANDFSLTEEPHDDFIYRGELDIFLPPGAGRRKVKSISVGLKTVVKLDLGPMRRGEEDSLFERRVEIAGDGIWLEEGMQRFDFTLIIPSNLAPHDWHHNGTIRHAIFAEIMGLPQSIKEPRKPFKSRSSASGNRSPSSRSRSNSPAPSPSIDATILSRAANLVLNDDEAPPYDPASQEDWLKGTFSIRRTVMILYNPHPTGGVSDLDERLSGFVEGIGPWELTMFADVFTICGLLRARVVLPSLSPAATVFAIRITLSQTHTITSPRDDPAITKPSTFTRKFIVIEEGKRPPPEHRHPGQSLPSLWRGSEAGGHSDGELILECKGRLPNDEHGRPSTLPGINTPIRVSHSFALDIFFSIHGETEAGLPMTKPGPGGLRVLRVNKPAIVPSCALIPPVVNLPSYETYQNDTFSENKRNIPCPLCGTKTHERLCAVCPNGTLPHPRHDHDPKLVGDVTGQCPACSRNVMPDGNPTWRDCACGVGIEQMEERMKKVVRDERGEDHIDPLHDKEAAERGRTR